MLVVVISFVLGVLLIIKGVFQVSFVFSEGKLYIFYYTSTLYDKKLHRIIIRLWTKE